jgi:hypothetical protein
MLAKLKAVSSISDLLDEEASMILLMNFCRYFEQHKTVSPLNGLLNIDGQDNTSS